MGPATLVQGSQRQGTGPAGPTRPIIHTLWLVQPDPAHARPFNWSDGPFNWHRSFTWRRGEAPVKLDKGRRSRVAESGLHKGLQPTPRFYPLTSSFL